MKRALDRYGISVADPWAALIINGAAQQFTGSRVRREGPLSVPVEIYLADRLLLLSRQAGIITGSAKGPSQLELVRFPIPVFGSPPQDFHTLGTLLSSAGAIGVSRTAYISNHPLLAVFTAVGSAVVWFTKPSAEELRQSLADRVRRKMALPPERIAPPAETQSRRRRKR